MFQNFHICHYNVLEPNLYIKTYSYLLDLTYLLVFVLL